MLQLMAERESERLAEQLLTAHEENQRLRGALNGMKMLASFLGAGLFFAILAQCTTPVDHWPFPWDPPV